MCPAKRGSLSSSPLLGDPAALRSELQLKALVMSLPGKEQDGSSARWKCQPTQQGVG